MRPVHLVESPKQVFGGFLNIVAARIVGEVVAQWRATKLLLEDIDLVQEQDDTSPHEPPRVDDRIEE